MLIVASIAQVRPNETKTTPDLSRGLRNERNRAIFPLSQLLSNINPKKAEVMTQDKVQPRGVNPENYRERLRDPRWFHRRDVILKQRGRACRVCGNTDHPEIHHLWHQGNPWEAPDQALEVLCNRCHALRTQLDYELPEWMRHLTTDRLFRLVQIKRQIRDQHGDDSWAVLVNWAFDLVVADKAIDHG